MVVGRALFNHWDMSRFDPIRMPSRVPQPTTMSAACACVLAPPPHCSHNPQRVRHERCCRSLSCVFNPRALFSRTLRRRQVIHRDGEHLFPPSPAAAPPRTRRGSDGEDGGKPTRADGGVELLPAHAVHVWIPLSRLAERISAAEGAARARGGRREGRYA